MPSCRLTIRVLPGARQNKIDGLHDGALKIRLSAPAVDGKANRALFRFLADRLKCRTRDLSIVTGQTSRQKVIEIRNLDEATARSLLGT